MTIVDARPVIVLVIESDEHQLAGGHIVAKTVGYIVRPTIAPIGIYGQHALFYFVVQIRAVITIRRIKPAIHRIAFETAIGLSE